MRFSCLVILCVFVLAPSEVFAAFFKCTNPNGTIQYSDKPCATSGKQLAIKTREASTAVPIHFLFDADGYELTDARRQQLEATIEAMYRVYTQVLRVAPHRPVTIDMKLFKRQADFIRYQRELTNETMAGAVGFYATQRKKAAAWHADNEAEFFRTIYHEASHAILGELAPWGPNWLEEGLASYFEGVELQSDGSLNIASVPMLEKRLKFLTQRTDVITLNRYLKIPSRSWVKLAGEGYPEPYTYAWSLSRYLMEDERGQRVIARLLQDLGAQKEYPRVQVLAQHYPGGFTRLELEWYDWLFKPQKTHAYSLH